MANYVRALALSLPLGLVAVAAGNPQDMTGIEFVCLAVLVVVDLTGFGMAVYLKRTYEESGIGESAAPLALTVAVAVTFVIGHVGATVIWTHLIEAIGVGIDALEFDVRAGSRVFGFSLLAGAMPALAYLDLLVKSFSNSSIDLVVGWKTAKPPETDFSKARAIYLKGDTEEALKVCREYFQEDPSSPRALFQAHKILMKEERPEEAANFLRDILKHFPKDDGVWTHAAYDLAGIYENHLDDRKTSDYMLGEIVKRTPKTNLGRLARGRLGRAWDVRDKPANERTP